MLLLRSKLAKQVARRRSRNPFSPGPVPCPAHTQRPRMCASTASRPVRPPPPDKSQSSALRFCRLHAARLCSMQHAACRGPPATPGLLWRAAHAEGTRAARHPWHLHLESLQAYIARSAPAAPAVTRIPILLCAVARPGEEPGVRRAVPGPRDGEEERPHLPHEGVWCVCGVG